MIDTATEALSVALFDDASLIGHVHQLVGRGHSEALMPVIAGLPDGGRADRIAVDVGPGSFTGVRIGVAAARALAFAWQAELVGYTAPAMLAVAARALDDTTDPLPIVITGGHGELFWQLFDPATLAPHDPVRSSPIADVAALLDMPTCYGSGAAALVAARGFGEAISLHPDAAHFLSLPASALMQATPLYVRGADAQPMAARAPKSA